MTLTSDPHAWLRPYYVILSAQAGFRQLAPTLQFEHLRRKVAIDHPTKAAEMREWSIGGQHGAIIHLASMVDQDETGRDETLWRVYRGGRTISCVAHYLPGGIDLRVMEGEEFRRTHLCRDAPEARVLAENWLLALDDDARLDESR